MHVSPKTRTLEQQILLASLRVDFDPNGTISPLLSQNPDWPTLIELARHHGVQPFFYQLLTKTDGKLLPEAVKDELTSDFIASTLTNLMLHKGLQKVVRLLEQAGIPAAPFKGPILAEEAYGDVASRSFCDLDFFVPKCRAKDALDLLFENGYRNSFDITLDQWQPLQIIENHLMLQSAVGLPIEIHWKLSKRFYDLSFDMRWVWGEGGASPDSKSLGQKISPEAHLILLCQHGTKHGLLQLKHILDVAMLVQATKTLDWEKVQNYAKEARCRKALALCLTLAQHYCGAVIPAEVLSRLAEQKEIERLVSEVERRLWSTEEEHFTKNWHFIWKVKDSLSDRLRFLLLLIVFPRVTDWETFHLPMRFFPLYYLLHPVRVFVKYVLQPIFTGSRKPS